MTWKDRGEHMDLFRVICSIVGVLIFIAAIGLFGLIIGKYCVFGGDRETKTNTPVLDKYHEAVKVKIDEGK